MLAFSGRVNSDRPTVSWNASGENYFEAMHLEQMLQRGHRVITQLLVIDGVVLQSFNQRQEVMGFRNENAVPRKQIVDAIDDFMNVFDMSKDVRGGNDLGFAVFGRSFFNRGAIEE